MIARVRDKMLCRSPLHDNHLSEKCGELKKRSRGWLALCHRKQAENMILHMGPYFRCRSPKQSFAKTSGVKSHQTPQHVCVYVAVVLPYMTACP